METTKYIWLNGEFIAWDEAKIHVLTHSLHYGGAVFEGIRVYETAKGAAVFRLRDHTKRLFYSAAVFKMKVPFSEEEINSATLELLRRTGLKQGYIRPIIYFGYGKMGLNPKGAPVDVAIACWPWGAYLPHEMVDIKVSKYMRIHPRSTVCDAKISGHYVNSILAVQQLEGSHYHEALLLDFDGNIAEGPGENFFIVSKGHIYTPPLGTILAGITRDTVIKIASNLGVCVTEKILRPEDVWSADEAFFTGTAAEVTLIRSLDDRQIGNSGKPGEISQQIKDAYLDVVYGRDSRFETYLSRV
ncbi:MAG: branched-chain amino acid transaminase [Deltaproteobacteria bacterium]|nr:branched-chain amino acid transaminase [Deltaproteobacteria bacterium]